MHHRTVLILILPALVIACGPRRVASVKVEAPATAPAASPAPTPPAARIEFEAQIRPLLQEKCSPCHFPGGRMYDRLPFDREETIRTLGEALFTRLREPLDLELLRTFLEQPPENPGATSR